MNEARKNDQGKPDLSLIPRIALVRLAEALEVGARKYSRYNYCAGLEVSRQVGALMRHVAAWMDGEEFDPQDGQHHLGSAMANCAMILHEMELGTLKDDRYRNPVAATASAVPAAPAIEPEAKPKLQLRVGGKYKDRLGQLRVIEAETGFQFNGVRYPYRSKGNFNFLPDGRYLAGRSRHDFDLVEEVVQGGRSFSFLEVGKTYLRRDGTTCTIVSFDRGGRFPYRADDDRIYTDDGRWFDDGKEYSSDIVAETFPSVPKVGGAGLTKEGPASTPEGGGAAAPADAEERFLKGSAT